MVLVMLHKKIFTYRGAPCSKGLMCLKEANAFVFVYRMWTTVFFVLHLEQSMLVAQLNDTEAIFFSSFFCFLLS